MSSLLNSEENKSLFKLRTKPFAALGLSLALLAGCATTDTRPTTPVYTGKERPDPTRPDRPEPPKPEEQKEEKSETDTQTSNIINEYKTVPRHLNGQYAENSNELSQIAVLLPLSSSSAGVRKQAESILAGAELALFQAGIKNVVLIPKDTGGLASKTREAAIEALQEGADAFVGPLFAQNVTAVQEIAQANQIPVLAFSTERSVAGNGVYLVSMPLEEEVSRIVDWASLNGITRLAMFGPANTYGFKVQAALEYEAAIRNIAIIKTELYDPKEPSPTDAAQRVAQTLIESDEYYPGEVAVLIPEQGTRLRSVAPLLPYYDVDISSIRLLGTGLWNSSDVWREPTLKGGVFASPDPAAVDQYETYYKQTYGKNPASMSTLGYDATLMSLVMLSQGMLHQSAIEQPDGFLGTNGLFRFRPDGTIQRSLSVLQVTGDGGVRVIDAGKKTFATSDGS